MACRKFDSRAWWTLLRVSPPCLSNRPVTVRVINPWFFFLILPRPTRGCSAGRMWPAEPHAAIWIALKYGQCIDARAGRPSVFAKVASLGTFWLSGELRRRGEKTSGYSLVLVVQLTDWLYVRPTTVQETTYWYWNIWNLSITAVLLHCKNMQTWVEELKINSNKQSGFAFLSPPPPFTVPKMNRTVVSKPRYVPNREFCVPLQAYQIC